MDATMPTMAATFVNPIAEGADPFVVRDFNNNPKRYLWCMSEGNRAIAIHTSSRLTSLGQKYIVWRAPNSGPVSQQVWAPELHFLDNHWHIYFAASNGKNENHRAYVLRSKDTDPLGEYQLFGPLATGDGDDGRSPNIWAIDMTVLELDNGRYAVWSGWDAPGTDRQYLYIARMKSTTEIAPPRVRLCNNDDFLWERLKPTEQERGLNEGPQVFQSEGGSTCIVYSCGASWLPTYKLGLLKLIGENPLNPSAWSKHAIPVFEGNGAGHSCFVKSLNEEELFHIFHSKWDDRPGWRRAIHIQRMNVSELDGVPLFGTPIEAGTEIPCPSGEFIPTGKLPYQESFDADDSLADWSYYGHHQFVSPFDSKLHIGVIPQEPINNYRCGEKVLLDRKLPTDYTVAVDIDFSGDKDGDQQAGILFRCSRISVGYNAQRGYYVGLFPQKGVIILGKMDGRRWIELDRAAIESLAIDQQQRLGVRVSGCEFSIFLEGQQQLVVTDESYDNGLVGLRTVDTLVSFSGFVIKPLEADPGVKEEGFDDSQSNTGN